MRLLADENVLRAGPAPPTLVLSGPAVSNFGFPLDPIALTCGSMKERIRYFFRAPRFPLLLDTGVELIALRSADECERRLPLLALTGAPRPVIDARAEGFAFYPDLETITPLTLKKDWAKAEIVALYDARKRPSTPAYTRSLPNRKLAEVVSDIVALVTADQPRPISPQVHP